MIIHVLPISIQLKNDGRLDKNAKETVIGTNELHRPLFPKIVCRDSLEAGLEYCGNGQGVVCGSGCLFSAGKLVELPFLPVVDF